MTASARETPETGAATRPVRVGDLELRMAIPVGRREEPGQRISFWFQITPASVALGRHLQALGTLRGCRALELGCGLGLAGVTAGRLGADVTFTDYRPEALEHARANARANGLQKAAFRRLDWEDPVKLEPFDLILGAEILYDCFYHDSLRDIFRQALAPGGRVILADRARRVVDRFLGRLVHDGYQCDEHLERVPAEGTADREIHVYSIYR